MTTATTERSLHARFLDLCCEMSPENVCCDGEAPASYVRKRIRELKAQWEALEAELGRSVTEEEVWRAQMAGRRIA